MKMENKMSRFYVDDKRWVIDRANWANSRLYRIHISEAGDEEHLRERVLLVRLERLLGKLHGPSAPKHCAVGNCEVAGFACNSNI